MTKTRSGFSAVAVVCVTILLGVSIVAAQPAAEPTDAPAEKEASKGGSNETPSAAAAKPEAPEPTSNPVTTESPEGITSKEAVANIPTVAEINASVEAQVQAQLEKEFPVKASYGSKGFRLESRDGNWQTNLQWRAQLRFTNPSSGDPRQIEDFEDVRESTFQARRLRMKIGGHGYRPWVGYYFEVDLQPTRSVSGSSESTSARVIDWRVTLSKWDWASLRVGQWKIDYNRERVDSSGRQQFVERSIVNRIFTIDRQVGVQLRGHLFKETPVDMRYYVGVFTGQGRGVRNDDSNLLWTGRLQWNFLGRDLAWKQTDVEYTEKPTGSIAVSAMTYKGRCTRWSSSGCGNLDGFESPGTASAGQFEIQQLMQEFAFKWRGFSLQQELHWKIIEDTDAGITTGFTGAYAQAGYFFHHLASAVPEELELGFRYAFVDEPNETDRTEKNLRQEYSAVANWFFAGHNNKLTADFSHLTLEDAVANRTVKENRVRVQWDVSF